MPDIHRLSLSVEIFNVSSLEKETAKNPLVLTGIFVIDLSLYFPVPTIGTFLTALHTGQLGDEQ